MSIAQSILSHRTAFLKRYGHRLSDEHRHALSAITRCRTEYYGRLSWHCRDCQKTRHLYRSCGHRSCPCCQNGDNTLWLERQRRKLLPVNYFMLTFTIPAELRSMLWNHQKLLYELLIKTTVGVCRDFAYRDKHLRGEIGQSVVLHTHTRRLEYHPHVHLVVPAGAIDTKRRLWRENNTGFLFSHRALATVFRARMLKALFEAGLLPKCRTPARWVVDCRCVGSGLSALEYLSRYLYRGVISEKQLLCDEGGQVTFSYREGGTGKRCTRTVDGAKFVWLLIQHTLPKGFRRVRDFGFLHGNAKRKRLLLQWCLKVCIETQLSKPRKSGVRCRTCGDTMQCLGLRPPSRLGYG